MSIKRIADAALSIAALLGVLGVLLGVAVAVFGVTPLIFRSGSMAPAIETGDLAFARHVQIKDLKVGDIVSVRTGDTRVTHRVVAVEEHQLQLKGDANKVPDAEPYAVASADRVFAHVPKAGYAIAWAMSPIGLVASGAFAALLLFLALGSGSRQRPDSGPEAEGAQTGSASSPDPSGGIARSLIAVAGVAIFAVASTTTLAYWTDSATVNASISSAAAPALPSVPNLTCTWQGGNLKTFTLAWGEVSGASQYQIFLRSDRDAPRAGTPDSTLSSAGRSYSFKDQSVATQYAYVVARNATTILAQSGVAYNMLDSSNSRTACVS